MTNVPTSDEMTFSVMPLRDIVVFPHLVVPLFIGREKSVLALEEVVQSDDQVLLLAQKDGSVYDPEPKDFYEVGTLGSILQMLRLPDGTVKVLVEGGARMRVTKFLYRWAMFKGFSCCV